MHRYYKVAYEQFSGYIYTGHLSNYTQWASQTTPDDNTIKTVHSPGDYVIVENSNGINNTSKEYKKGEYRKEKHREKNGERKSEKWSDGDDDSGYRKYRQKENYKRRSIRWD